MLNLAQKRPLHTPSAKTPLQIYVLEGVCTNWHPRSAVNKQIIIKVNTIAATPGNLLANEAQINEKIAVSCCN